MSVARWIAASLLMLYGFAKINGSQFTVLESELARPMGEVDGFWLTWYYFGYSKVYGTFLALAQIGGALLLMWPRTVLLGALALVPVMTNIILIDIFYGVAPSATLVAILILGCLVTIIAPHVPRLRSAVLLDVTRGRVVPRLAGMVAVVAATFSFTWWIANYNNIHPTRIDGAWSVAPASDPANAAVPWRDMFFERNRAYLVVFRSADGRTEQHHFEVDGDGTLRIWERWLRKGDVIGEGTVLPGDEITLELREGEDRIPLRLRRRSRPR